MSVQMSYGYSTPRGIPGGLYDQSPYVVDTRLNEADNGAMLFGMGVVQGSVPGTNIDLPTASSTAADFEGITVNGFTQQHDLEGKIALNNNQSVGVLRQGRLWVRLADEVDPAYGDNVYLSIGADAGLFYNAEQKAEEIVTTIKLNAKFIGGKGSGAVAPIALFAGE